MCIYSALFFFLNAVLSGLVLTNVFGEFPARVIQWGSGSKLSWVWAMRHCEFGTHPLVRLAGRVHLCQGHALNRHGVRCAIPRRPHTTSVTRLTLPMKLSGVSAYTGPSIPSSAMNGDHYIGTNFPSLHDKTQAESRKCFHNMYPFTLHTTTFIVKVST